MEAFNRPPPAADAALKKNAEAQSRNNQARLRELRRYAAEGFARVFDQAPELLNANAPALPGYVDDPETPYGVKFIERRLWQAPEDRPGPAARAPRPAVESLFLIGSCGSIGHNAESDLDYWVCFEKNSFSPRGRELFQRKLALISAWARQECGVEANFYCVDLDDLARGRITHMADAEIEGEVAPSLLLEELYRTFLFVAGRPPLWPAAPLNMDRDAYRNLAELYARGGEAEFLDLGFPTLPEPQHALAAALWLAHKSEADPFKGLMKMTALLEYVESDFKGRLICEEVKEAVLAAGEDETPIDPYKATIERVTGFGRSSLTPAQLDLLRTAAVLRVLGATPGRMSPPPPPSSPKSLALKKWLDQWGWPPERLGRLAEYGRWSERERLELVGEILRALVGLYIRIAGRLSASYAREIDPQSRELAPFAARLLARQAGLESTLETLPAHFRNAAQGIRPALRRDPEAGLWNIHVLREAGRAPTPDNLIYSCRRAARAAAWLTHNPLGRDWRERLETWPAPTGEPAKLADLPGLLKTLAALFPPFENAEAVWTAGSRGPALAILDFEEDGGDLLAADFISRTGWGEMRHDYLDLEGICGRADKYLKIAQALRKIGEIRPEDLVFHVADSSSDARKDINNIRAALLATLRRPAASGPPKGASRLDL